MTQTLSPFFNVRRLDNGAVKMRMEDLPEQAWNILVGKDNDSGPAKYYKTVDWLFRAVNLRAAGLAGMPFVILDSAGNEFDTSETWMNKVGWFSNPYKFLYLAEMSLCMAGRAYFLRIPNVLGAGLKLQYMAPENVSEQYSKDTGELSGFQRTLKNTNLVYLPEDVLYFWYPDYTREIGPGSSPAAAALNAAGVLYNMDKFAEMFFQRGAVKATLLTISGNTIPIERERIKAWWNTVMTGVKNAFKSEVVNADTIKPVIVGEGMESLANSELTKERRQAISTALGVPQYKLFSEATNRATAEQADRDFYNETIIPEARIIAASINEQLWPGGEYRFEFAPEKMDIFQHDETERAQSFATYVSAGIPLDVAAEMLGLELPDGVTLAEPEPAPVVVQATPEMPPAPIPEKSLFQAELDAFETFALRRIKEGKEIREWNAEVLPAALVGAIQGAIDEVSGLAEVKQIFADARRWEDTL